MIITCPKCGKTTEISKEQLAANGNKLRCSSCGSMLTVDDGYAYILPEGQSLDDLKPQQPVEDVKAEEITDETGAQWNMQPGDDPLLRDAIEYVHYCNAITIEMLAAYLQVPPERAATIMQQLEGKGIVGPFTGGPRTILIPHNTDPFSPTPRNRQELGALKQMRERMSSGNVKVRSINCSGCSIAIFVLLLITLLVMIFKS